MRRWRVDRAPAAWVVDGVAVERGRQRGDRDGGGGDDQDDPAGSRLTGRSMRCLRFHDSNVRVASSVNKGAWTIPDGGGTTTTNAGHPYDHRVTIALTIAEDDFLVREGILAVLASVEEYRIVDACGDLDDLLASVAANAPDVVLTDIRMPPTLTDEGIVAARLLRRSHPSVGVVVLSQFSDPSFAVALLSDGADGRGYLLKERVGDERELVQAVSAVSSGGSYVDPAVIASLVDRQVPGSPLHQLTPREHEVLAQMARGKDNAAIAESLYIGVRAVEKHNASIFLKLGLTEAEHVDRRVRAVLMFLDAST